MPDPSVKFGKPKEIVLENKDKLALAHVEFRPLDNYEGKFGMDWMRVGTLTALIKDPDYNSLLKAALDNAGNELAGDDIYKELEKQYSSLRLESDPNKKYYIPYLNIYPHNPSEWKDTTTVSPIAQATLQVILIQKDKDVVNIEIEPEKKATKLIEIENAQITVDAGEVTPTSPKKTGGNITIKIKEGKELSGETIINVWASKADKQRKLAGRLILCANKPNNRKTVKTIVVKVKTDIDSKPTTSDPLEKEIVISDESLNTQIKFLKQYLPQAFIYPHVAEVTLDLTEDVRFKIDTITGEYGEFIYKAGTEENSNYQDGAIYIEKKDPSGKTQEDDTYLLKCLEEEFRKKNKQYQSDYLVFVFDTESCKTNYGAEHEGRARNIGKKSMGMFKVDHPTDLTLMHELLHCMGLYHTHRDGSKLHTDQKFVFAISGMVDTSTDNIMSYNSAPQVKYILKWQWKILQKSL